MSLLPKLPPYRPSNAVKAAYQIEVQTGRIARLGVYPRR